MIDPENGIAKAIRYAFRRFPLTSDVDAEKITERMDLHEQVHARFNELEDARLAAHRAQVNRLLSHLKRFEEGPDDASTCP